MFKLVNILILFLIIYVLLSKTVIHDKFVCYDDHLYFRKVGIINAPGTHRLYNPSVIEFKDKYVVCARYTNRTFRNLFYFLIHCFNYQSNICICIYTKDWKFEKIILPIPFTKLILEDPRITYDKTMDKFLISITENMANMIYPCLYVLDTSFNFIGRYEYKNYIIPKRISNSSFLIQKNWCISYSDSYNKPIIHTDTYPTWRMYSLDFTLTNTVNMSTLIEYNSTNFFEDIYPKYDIIRCSTSWKPFTEHSYICAVHIKFYNAYLTYSIGCTIRTLLVEIDKYTLLPIKKTHCFCLDKHRHSCIQFVSGLETDSNYVYLTYGIGDYKTEICRISKRKVLKMLK